MCGMDITLYMLMLEVHSLQSCIIIIIDTNWSHFHSKMAVKKCFSFEKISKGFEQKLASFGLKTPFKVQMGSQKSSLSAIGKPNGHSKAEQS